MTNARIATTVFMTSVLLAGGCGDNQNGESSSQSKLFINELQPSNKDTITDEKGEADDWIEIVNLGGEPVDMRGFTLADSSGTTQVISGSIVVSADAFQLFWADDSPSQGANHLGFKLGAKAGDKVVLRDSSGKTLDEVSFGPAVGHESYARFPDGSGAFAWCDAPTPGASNGALCGG
jgi:hypothetical protein